MNTIKDMNFSKGLDWIDQWQGQALSLNISLILLKSVRKWKAYSAWRHTENIHLSIKMIININTGGCLPCINPKEKETEQNRKSRYCNYSQQNVCDITSLDLKSLCSVLRTVHISLGSGVCMFSVRCLYIWSLLSQPTSCNLIIPVAPLHWPEFRVPCWLYFTYERDHLHAIFSMSASCNV